MSAPLSRRALFGRRAEPEPESGPRVAVLAAGCLATTGVACGICVDPCEPRALRMKPQLGGRATPIIDAAACTGCGDCIPICPVASLSLGPAPEICPQESRPCA